MMTMQQYTNKKTNITEALKLAKQEYQRLCLQAENGDTKAKEQLQAVRDEIHSYEIGLLDLDAAWEQCQIEMKRQAEVDQGKVRKTALETAEKALEKRVLAANGIQRAIERLGIEYRKYREAVEEFQKTISPHDSMRSPNLAENYPIENVIGWVLAEQDERLNNLTITTTSPIDRGKTVPQLVEQNNAGLLRRAKQLLEDVDNGEAA